MCQQDITLSFLCHPAHISRLHCTPPRHIYSEFLYLRIICFDYPTKYTNQLGEMLRFLHRSNSKIHIILRISWTNRQDCVTSIALLEFRGDFIVFSKSFLSLHAHSSRHVMIKNSITLFIHLLLLIYPIFQYLVHLF